MWSWRSTGMIVLLFLGLVFSHKLPLTIVVLILALFIPSLWLLRRIKTNVSDTRVTGAVRKATTLMFIGGSLLLLQNLFATPLGASLIRRALGAVGLFETGREAALYSDPILATEAVPVGRNLESIITRRLHGLVLIPIGALSWLLLLIGVFRQQVPKLSVFVVLVTAVVTNLFAIVALVAPAVGGSVARFLFLAEPILISIIVIVIHNRTRVLKLVAVLLIFSQLFSGIVIAPDHPNSMNEELDAQDTQKYLSSQDLAAKNHGHEFIQNQVHTDWWHAQEETPTRINRYTPPEERTDYQEFDDDAFLDGSLVGEEYEYVVLRNQTVFRTGVGWYRITWNPQQEFETQYSNIYDSGETGIYKRS